MKCSISVEAGEGLKLKNNLRLVKGMAVTDSHGQIIVQHYNTFIFWKLVIQGTERSLTSEEKIAKKREATIF